MTADEIYIEYARGLEDPTYIIENYFKTFDKTNEGFVPFKLFPRQLDIIKAYEEHRRNLVTKPRQAGVSTTTAAYLAVKIGFADEKNPENILIIANKQAMAFEFLEKIKDFINQLPRWLWGPEYYGDEVSENKSIYSTESKKELALPNKCRVKAVATSKDALRGFTPTYFVMDEAAFIDDGDIVYGAAQPALGCLTKDSLILTDNGLVELGELVVEKDKLGFTKLDVPHMVCNKLGELTPATETFVSEYGDTYKIKTKLGIELEGSWKHPLLVKRGDEGLWCRMSELRVGDNVKIGYNQNLFGHTGLFEWDYTPHWNSRPINIPSNLTDNLDFAYLLGLFVAEGNFQSGGITITNKDTYIEEFLLNDYAKLGRPFARYDDRHFMFNSKELVAWFDEFGLKKHNARDKEIPLPLLKMPKDVIVNFLQGMFDGDGMSTYKEIKYSSTSKKLVQTLQTLLLNFGIISHVRKQVQRTSSSSIIPNKNHVCTMYDLFIYSDHAIKFYNEIGFRLDRKQKNINKLLNRKQNSRYVNVTQDYIYQILKDNGTIKRDVRFLDRFWGSKYQRLSYHSLYKLIDRFPNEERLLNLLSQIEDNSNYYWDVITSIEVSEDYTYDLHVPKTNSFISNGIISHNTGGRSVLISCVTDDTFVFTDKGIKEVGDFVSGQDLGGYEVSEYSVLGKDKLRKGGLFYNNGYVETRKIVTPNSMLTGSLNHKLFTFNQRTHKYDWVELKDLSVGDYVGVQYGMDVWGHNDDTSDFIPINDSNKIKNNFSPNKITSDIAYFLGLYISEGSSYKKYVNGNHVGSSITITCGDDISETFDKIGLNYSSHDKLHYTVGSKQLVEYMEYLGFDLSLKATEKVIPARLLEMSRPNIVAMLQGIFDGDGFSRKDKGSVGIGLSSKRLVEQIRIILTNFGILSTYQEVLTMPTKKVKVSSLNYRLELSREASSVYYREIGFRFNRKMLNESNLIYKKTKTGNRNDIIPNSIGWLKNLKNRLGFTWLQLRSCGIGSTFRVDISRYDMIKAVDFLKENYTWSFTEEDVLMMSIINQNLKWVKITKIEEGKDWTYDFSLPNSDDFWCHSVVYNSILGHQTPNGQDSLYYKTYEQSKLGKNDFNIVEMRWYEDLRYNKDLRWVKGDEEIEENEYTFESYKKMLDNGYKPTSSWYEDMCKALNNDERMIAQELDVSFVGSGNNVVKDEYIQFQEDNFVLEPKFVEGEEGEFWIWEEPKEGHKYVLSCLPPGEKVLTNNGIKDIDKVLPNDKLINENGELVNIINQQISSVIDEDIYEIKVSNTYRTTKFTKNHPLLVSQANLKRNYNREHNLYDFNERYHDFNFKFTKTEDVCVGDWTKVPNTYKKIISVDDNLWNKYISDSRKDFRIDSPLNDESFWWLMGLYLGDGHLYSNTAKHIYSINLTFSNDELDYMYEAIDVIGKLFGRVPSVIKRDDNNCHVITFNSKILHNFILDNLGKYSYGKKINEWIKYLPKNLKYELIRGYFDSDGSWVKAHKRRYINSKITFTSISLELLEGFQDILFSIGLVSVLNKLRDAKTSIILGRVCNQKETYSLSLHNHDSINLHKLIYKKNDTKLNKFNIDDFKIKNKRIISDCYLSKDNDYIYFKIKNINRSKHTGKVYNFETETHTFMCKNITTHNCDVSRGDGEDYSVFTVIDFTTMEQVMEYQGKVQPDILADYVFKYSNLYNAYVVVDVVGVGVATVLKLLELGCKNMHYDNMTGNILKDNRLIAASTNNKVPGFNASRVRTPMIAHFEFSVREVAIKIRSKRITSELKTFVYKNGKPDHKKGYNDDCIMSLAMGLWVLEHNFKQLEVSNKKTKAILSSWVTNTNQATQNYQSIYAKNTYDKNTFNKQDSTGYVNKNNKSDNTDNLWLFSGLM